MAAGASLGVALALGNDGRDGSPAPARISSGSSSAVKYTSDGKCMIYSDYLGWLMAREDPKVEGRVLLRDSDGGAYAWDVDTTIEVDLSDKDLLLRLFQKDPSWDHAVKTLPGIEDRALTPAQFRTLQQRQDGTYMFLTKKMQQQLSLLKT